MDIPVRRVQAALHALDAAESVVRAAQFPAAILPGLAEAFRADRAAWRGHGATHDVVTVQRHDTADDPVAASADEQVLTTRLEGAPGTSARLVLARFAPDFDEAEVQLLEALRSLLSRRLTELSRADVRRNVLSSREQEVLQLVAAGLTDAAIAHRLGCRPRTVDKHLEHAYRTLGVGNRAAAVAHWLREGIPPG